MSRPIKEFDHVRIKQFDIEGYVVDVRPGHPDWMTVDVNIVEHPLSEEAKARADILTDTDWALFDCDRSELELIECLSKTVERDKSPQSAE